MSKRCGLLTALIFALAVAATSSPARADKAAGPFTYRVVAPGEKFVFVMVAPGTVEEEVREWPEEAAAGTRAMRRIYPRSGMYRNDGSNDPLWTVGWYAFEVTVASDGVHLIRHGPWASSTTDEALSFFANGDLLRTFSIRELVDNNAMLHRSVSHFEWRNKGELDDGRMEYTLTTVDGNRFVFDIRTGAIASDSRAAKPGRRGGWWMAAGVAAAGAVAWLTWRLRARASERRA
jgi:hypothetical protein